MAEYDKLMSEIVSEEFARAEGAAAAPAVVAPADLSGLKDIFCDHWPTARRILQVMLPFLPDEAKKVVKVIIAIGDRLEGAICE